jgi:amino acid adenylation domain-containing protein
MRVLAGEDRTNYPITLSVDDYGKDFGFKAQTSPEIDPKRLLAYMETAVRALVDALEDEPQRQARTLSILPPTERHRLLIEFNDTDQVFPEKCQLHQLIEKQAALQPDAIALIFDVDVMCYGDLNRRANQVAAFLRDQGVGVNDRVAVCMNRSMEMIVGILGILKAGAAYMPVDPAYPMDRIEYMLADSAPKAIVLQSSLRTSLPGIHHLTERVPYLLLDVDFLALAGLAENDVDSPALEEASSNLMYVLYTSGSTGKPKGVAMPQGPLANLIYWQASDRSGLAQRERTLQFSALGFDATFQEIFSSLCYGATLVLLKEEVRRDPQELVRLMRKQKVERIFLPFVALQNIVLAALEMGEALPELKTLITAGEQLRISPAMVQFFEQRPGRALHNYYGPTESHVVTTHTLKGAPTAWPVLPPIGKPIANTQIYVLDAQLRLVPLGGTGEIYIAGASLADGYLNRPDLTEERFVFNPYGGVKNDRMYKTGDIGRCLEDGSIEYLGRNDSQVKIRGFRVEPGEIETALASCEGVREAVVIAREDTPGSKRLVAYLLAQEGIVLSPPALRSQLLDILPEYMVPAAFIVMESFPISPNGKLERRALPAPDHSDVSTRVYEPPVGEIESEIAEIWCCLLGIDRVGRHDNFFELGGHSLLATQLMLRLREHCQVEVPLRTIFEMPTLLALADFVRALQIEIFLGDDADIIQEGLNSLSKEELMAMLNEDSQNE